MFTVTIEPRHRMIHVTIVGFWSMDVLPAYVAELRRQTDALAAVGGCRRILVDMTDYPIQSQEVAEAHAQIIGYAKRKLGAPTAVIMPNALSKLQAKRMANLAGRELFDDAASARAWLLEQPDAAAA